MRTTKSTIIQSMHTVTERNNDAMHVLPGHDTLLLVYVSTGFMMTPSGGFVFSNKVMEDHV